MNTVTIHKIATNMGYPLIRWSDTLNGWHKRMSTLYRRQIDGYYFTYRGEHHSVKEQRPIIVQALDRLDWQPGRDCLRSAPWLQGGAL